MKRFLSILLTLVTFVFCFGFPASASETDSMWVDLMEDVSYFDVERYSTSGLIDSQASTNLDLSSHAKKITIYPFCTLSDYYSLRIQFYSSVAPESVSFNGVNLTKVKSQYGVYTYELTTTNYWRKPALTIVYPSETDFNFTMQSFELRIGGYFTLSGSVLCNSNTYALNSDIELVSSGKFWRSYNMKVNLVKSDFDKIVFFGNAFIPVNSDFGVTATCNGLPIPVLLEYRRLYPYNAQQDEISFWLTIDCDDTVSQSADIILEFKNFYIYENPGTVKYKSYGYRISSKPNPFASFAQWLKSIFVPEVDETVKESLDKSSEELNKANQQMNSVNKPSPDNIDISIDEFVSGNDISNATGVLAAPMNNDIILPLFVISVTLALVSYVLFGKR